MQNNSGENTQSGWERERVNLIGLHCELFICLRICCINDWHMHSHKAMENKSNNHNSSLYPTLHQQIEEGKCDSSTAMCLKTKFVDFQHSAGSRIRTTEEKTTCVHATVWVEMKKKVMPATVGLETKRERENQMHIIKSNILFYFKNPS